MNNDRAPGPHVTTSCPAYDTSTVLVQYALAVGIRRQRPSSPDPALILGWRSPPPPPPLSSTCLPAAAACCLMIEITAAWRLLCSISPPAQLLPQSCRASYRNAGGSSLIQQQSRVASKAERAVAVQKNTRRKQHPANSRGYFGQSITERSLQTSEQKKGSPPQAGVSTLRIALRIPTPASETGGGDNLAHGFAGACSCKV